MSEIEKRIQFSTAKDNYKEFEKHTNCKHKRKNEFGINCRECDIAWLIERCRTLEKTLSDFKQNLKGV